MERGRRSRAYQVLTRWLCGTVLISWRYVWETTPLHRLEQEGDPRRDGSPNVPGEVIDEDLQPADSGVGPLFHRQFRVRIADAELTAEQLMAAILDDFARFVPSEVVDVRTPQTAAGDMRRLRVGDEFVVEMPGPWDGPVRVVHVSDDCLRLATLRGHLEAGQVQFRAEEEDDLLIFQVEAWARPATRLVHLLYSHLRLAKEIQLNMWVRFCLAAAHTAGGHPADGVHISTMHVR